MKFVDWYLKISIVSAMIGGSMEYFMIKTGFYDKVTVLEAEKRSWESTPEAQAIRDALNPWREHDKQAKKSSKHQFSKEAQSDARDNSSEH
ncbi:uncharacterized protein [Primulina huaijiensis]|uniref:uncharacterized protein n=1 Tax=Primulina huaijiensis TaxID=1492673 RepID=UPI003CC7819D